MEMTIEVLKMNKINFSGNVIPVNWYKQIQLKDGKPDLVAITLLSEIVYWYRPREVRDEKTGQLIGMEKRFSADKLQRSYSSFSEQFGITKRQARDAIARLEKAGLVDRELRNITAKGKAVSNVLFIGVNVEQIEKVTHPYDVQTSHPMTFERNTYDVQTSHPPTFERNTYTETTNTETTTEIGKDSSPQAESETPEDSKDENKDSGSKDKPKDKSTLSDEEKEIRSEMRLAMCYMVYKHKDLGSLTAAQAKALNAEIARIRKNDRDYTIDHMRFWWNQIWRHDWRNKEAATAEQLQAARITDIRAGMAQAYEQMSGDSSPEWVDKNETSFRTNGSHNSQAAADQATIDEVKASGFKLKALV